jgi:glycosyltransferase involved in cell wall biosynthesis
MPEEEPLVATWMERARCRIFDWSDDFARYATQPADQEAIGAAVDRLLDRVDLVVAVNEELARRARRHGRETVVIHNATRMAPQPGPPRGPGARALRARLSHPILGYAGFVNEHRIDLAVVEALARAHPEASLVFLGPVFRDFSRRFPAFPNINFHPPVPHERLQDYLRAFDVCLLPHLVNAHTAGNDPIKLYDYLSSGRPVVTTPVAGSERVAGVARVADSPAAFCAAVEAALAEADPGLQAARLEVARQNSWAVRARQVENAVRDAWSLGALPAAE